MLNNSGESGQPCLLPDLRGNAFSFSLLRMFAVGLYCAGLGALSHGGHQRAHHGTFIIYPPVFSLLNQPGHELEGGAWYTAEA